MGPGLLAPHAAVTSSALLVKGCKQAAPEMTRFASHWEQGCNYRRAGGVQMYQATSFREATC